METTRIIPSRFLRRHWTLAVAASSFGILLGGLAVQPVPSVGSAAVPAFAHIFTIVMENHSYSEIVGNTSQAPYINSLANQYGLATQYFAVSHPSLPNYLALTGGDTFGVTTDCTDCFQAAANIVVDRVEPSGRSWKAYMESMPSACFIGDSGEYVQKHDPFIYYNDVRLNTAECAKVVPYTQLGTDLGSVSTTPNYVWITPNLMDDMHDGSISQGDTWLSTEVPKILNSPAWKTQSSLLQIVWDEDDYSQRNQVPALVIANNVTPGFRSAVIYNHYSVLRTVESSWNLTTLTANDSGAAPMSDFYTSPATSPPGPPRGVSATAGTRDSATVSWSTPLNNGGCAISAYAVKSSPGTHTAQTSGSTTAAKVTGLTTGTTYTFTVTATNCVGAGPPSTPSNAITARKR